MSPDSFPQAPVLTSSTLPDIQEHLTNQLTKKRLPTNEVIDILTQLGEHWLNPHYFYRKEVEKYLPSITGYSKEMIRESLDITFQEFTNRKLSRIIVTKPTSHVPVGLVTHVLAGNIFISGLFGMVYGLLAQTPQLIKTSSKEPLFPFLFAESVKETSPVLSNYLVVCSWKGGEGEIEEVIFRKSQLVIAYGNDETIDDIAKKIYSPTRFLGFGHKISFGIIGKEYLTRNGIEGTAEKAAYDISLYDQQGCLSPHFFYIESGGEISPDEFSKVLAEKMNITNQRLSRGKISLQESSVILQHRGTYEFKKIQSSSISIYSSTPSTEWTVVYTEDKELNISCLNRFVFIKPYSKVDLIYQEVTPLQGKIQCIGLGVSEDRQKAFQNVFGKLSVPRYCDIGSMQKPAIEEMHNGKPNMSDFIKTVKTVGG